MIRKLTLAALFVCALGVGSASASSIIDLTTAGATFNGVDALSGGAFTVTQVSPQSTGTGVIDSFLRIQQNTAEQGYNTSLGTPLDDKGGPFTRALTLSEVPIVNLAGTDYRQFLLDINQNNQNESLLSLNQIQIFESTADRNDHSVIPATATDAPILSFLGANYAEVFRLNNMTPNYEIKLDYDLNPGSGAGDMFLYVANSLFTGVGSTNVILYSQFGHMPGVNPTNDGFEEWAVLKAAGTRCVGCEPLVTPEPGSLILLGSGLAGAAAWLRRRREASQQ